MSINKKYELVIGLEVHAQLNTNSKIFAPDAVSFGAAPNTQLSFITLAHPGTLPKLNQQVIDHAIKIGLATNCQIRYYNEFSRKNYFYADLPKGYQISQFDTPICHDGHINLRMEGQPHIRINRIHLEEDAGKSTHDQDPRYSLIDLNRAGVPLVEIVSEPDLRSAEQAAQYVSQIKQLVQYLEICDGNMEEGSLRCDANVSVRLQGGTQLGERTEVKNINSLRFLKKAIQYEFERQVALLEQGQTISRETRGFDADKGITYSLRSKELAHDYRYFPEPDLQPVVVKQALIDRIKAEMPPLPNQLIKKYTTDFGLSDYDAAILTEEKHLALYFNAVCEHTQLYKAAANWLIGPIKSYLNEQGINIDKLNIAPGKLAELITLTNTDKISFSVAAQELLPLLLQNTEADIMQLAQNSNLLQQQDDALLDSIADNLIQQFPDKVKAYQKGRKGLIGFFVGQVMRTATVKLNPKTVNKVLQEKLNA